MKTRLGFVANSSTTSFIIYGAMISNIDRHDIEKIVFDLAFHSDHRVDSYQSPDYGNEWFVGVSWDDIRDEETGKQFKDRIKAAFAKVLGEDAEVKTHSKGWYDG